MSLQKVCFSFTQTKIKPNQTVCTNRDQINYLLNNNKKKSETPLLGMFLIFSEKKILFNISCLE